MKKIKKTTSLLLLLLVTGNLCLAQTSQSQASSQSQFAIPLSNPGKPGSLEVGLVSGAINVTGYDGKEVIVQYTFNEKRRRDRNDTEQVPAGMKRIPSNNGGLEAHEKDNKVTIDTDYPSKIANLDIKVPVNFSLSLSTVNGGGIEVKNVHGNLDLNNVNGAISVTDVSGSANATTVNGDIVASFTSLDQNTPMAFSTLNGKIDVTLPASAKFTAKMKTNRGEIYTDFNMDLNASNNPKVVTSDHGGYKVSVDNWQYGNVNGGGPELLFKTFNGNIYIRKK